MPHLVLLGEASVRIGYVRTGQGEHRTVESGLRGAQEEGNQSPQAHRPPEHLALRQVSGASVYGPSRMCLLSCMVS
jgi:hypothetical protein